MEEQRIPALNFYLRTNLSAAASLSLIAERFQYVKSVKHEAFSVSWPWVTKDNTSCIICCTVNIPASFEEPVKEHFSEPEKHSISLEYIINLV